MDPYHLAMLIAGVALLGGALLPNVLAGRPFSPGWERPLAAWPTIW